MIHVILCSYNGEAYIGRQIESIMNQSADLNLFVYDDKSSDGTADVVREYVSKYDGRIFLTVRDESTGSACRNFLKALYEVPKADYYMFSDQDDIWDENKAEKLLSEIRNAAGPALAFSDSRIADGNDNQISPSFVQYQKLSPQRTGFNQLLILNQVTGAALMINDALREVITEKQIPENAVMHDHYLAIIAAAFGEIRYIDDKLYSYCQHGDNTLGARKGSFTGEVGDRLGFGEASKEEMDRKSRDTYATVFKQAEEIRTLYADRLDKEKLEALDAFISIQSKDRIGKIKTILKYGFTFDTFYRTVGEMIFI